MPTLFICVLMAFSLHARAENNYTLVRDLKIESITVRPGVLINDVKAFLESFKKQYADKRIMNNSVWIRPCSVSEKLTEKPDSPRCDLAVFLKSGEQCWSSIQEQHDAYRVKLIENDAIIMEQQNTDVKC